MDKFKMLSGEELVTQGAKKGNTTLPELGLKDVVPNGSWLEQKQVQNALEARRHIVEVERIEKCGTLSHADWNEELQLAEVTKKAGGHWQYVGHNVGRHLYLYPVEALYLMEINCLRLKYNDVTVSIQQAYSLLLKDNSSLIQYKVYASLSRLGYKVLRHAYTNTDYDDTAEKAEPARSDPSEVTNTTEGRENENIGQNKEENIAKQTSEIVDCEMKNTDNIDITNNSNDTIELTNKDKGNLENKNADDKTVDNIVSNENKVLNNESSYEQASVDKENCEVNDCEILHMETDNTDETKVSSTVNLCDEDSQKNEDTVEVNGGTSNNGSVAIIQIKLDSLSCRELKPSNSDMIHKCFNENLPDLYQKHIVTVKAPEEQHIPRNVFLNSTAYVLNLENLKLKSVTPMPSSSCRTYSVSDEADARVMRIRSGHSNESAQTHLTPQFFPNMRFYQPHQFRQFHWNQFNYNWTYQRPFFPSMPFRFQFFPRMQPMFRCIPSRSMIPNLENDATRRPRKRKRNNPKMYHLESIKKLAAKLKGLVASGNRQEENIQALQRLIDTYNVRYQTRIELTDQLDVVDNEVIVETIDLDDDEQPNSKKKKKEEMESYDENFNALKQFSVRMKELEVKKVLSTRHKRAFSNVIRTFNKSYNADVYVGSNFDVIDRRRIVIASSSDSECAIEEVQSTVENTPKPQKGRKLRNPFYILKQLSEKQAPLKTSVANESSRIDLKKKFEYSEHLKKMFSKYWLPNEDDFGRAEVPLKSQVKNQFDHNEDFLYQFIRSQPVKFKNWLDAKIAYWQSCKEAALKFEASCQNESNIKLDSIINPEDCTDLRNVLKKLSVIKTQKRVREECCLSIHFDVYNRDVPNFRKSNKPKPHFRVICIEESSSFPTGIEFATLHSKYKDDVGIVFAIVGISSISYLQMNPVDLPIYIPANNLP